MTVKAAIRAISWHLPERIVDNETLARELGDATAEAIAEKSGIRSRRLAGPDECASDLAASAAGALFRDHGVGASAIDYLLLCTQTPDYFLPATACIVHERLGLRPDCGAIDINQGCSGFVYGLSLAKGLVESGIARNVLLVTADTYSKLIDARDRGARVLFGDGAAATLIAAVESETDLIGPFVFGTDGRGAENLIVRAGGMRQRNALAESDARLFMNGAEVFTFAMRAVPPAVQALLAASALPLADVDYFVFHQASRFILDRLRVKLGIAAEKFAVQLQDFGNTVSSTIPIALERSAAEGAIGPDARVMTVGFGVGYSWAAAMIRPMLGGLS